VKKNLKKLSVVFSVAALSTAALAGGPDNMAMATDASNSAGFFLGATAGMGMTDMTVTATDVDNGVTDSVVMPSQKKSFLGGLLGGYQAVLSNDFYWGIAANAMYNSLNGSFFSETDSVNGSDSNTLKNTFQGGADIRLGMKVNSATPYVLGGVEAGSWKFGNVSTGEPSYSKTRTLVGPKVGAGVLFAVDSNWQAGLEYAYTWFGNINAVRPTDPNDSVKVAVDQGQVMASAVYTFNS
jgi:opacity protein-like surface antigen